jgi:hypothetical protein
MTGMGCAVENSINHVTHTHTHTHTHTQKIGYISTYVVYIVQIYILVSYNIFREWERGRPSDLIGFDQSDIGVQSRNTHV